jgi:hypothetical protein
MSIAGHISSKMLMHYTWISEQAKRHRHPGRRAQAEAGLRSNAVACADAARARGLTYLLVYDYLVKPVEIAEIRAIAFLL